MTVVGVRKNDFKTKDKKTGEEVTITGYNVYLTSPISPKVGDGVSAERIYLSERKMEEMGYYPKIGDNIRLFYNRYGKIDMVELENE